MSWEARLTAESSLFDVYRQARIVASTKSNLAIAIACAFFIFAVATINTYFFPLWDQRVSLLAGMRVLSETGFAFSSTLLGFLISGFAIFASITKPEVFVILAKLPHTAGDMSRLHFIFFNFLFVFIHYLAFMALCIAIKVLGYPDGPLSPMLSLVHCYFPQPASLALGLFLSLLSGYTAFLIVLLKSFIWNMYQAVLITIGANDVVKQIAIASNVDTHPDV